jgi:hypothetical protein
MTLGYESYLAFKNRADYEYRDGSQGWALVSYYVRIFTQLALLTKFLGRICICCFLGQNPLVRVR